MARRPSYRGIISEVNSILLGVGNILGTDVEGIAVLTEFKIGFAMTDARRRPRREHPAYQLQISMGPGGTYAGIAEGKQSSLG